MSAEKTVFSPDLLLPWSCNKESVTALDSYFRERDPSAKEAGLFPIAYADTVGRMQPAGRLRPLRAEKENDSAPPLSSSPLCREAGVEPLQHSPAIKA